MTYIDFDSDSFAPIDCCNPKKNTAQKTCKNDCEFDRQDFPISCEWILINTCEKECGCGIVSEVPNCNTCF